MDLGWQSLTPAEQQAAISGGTIGFGASMLLGALFGGRYLRRGRPKRRKAKRRRR